MSETKLWAGRFNEPTDAFVEAFTASVEFDRRLYRYDIQGSIAHATMLARSGILSESERDSIVSGLKKIRNQIEADQFPWSIELEDVHMNIESALTAEIGDTGKRLHTGRSRNDQVATDIRLWLRDEIALIIEAILQFQQALLDIAEREADTLMPGFTHLQIAQPVTFGHHMMAWFEMLERDRQRLSDCSRRVNVMPLGAAALAGTTYPIDRHYTAELLGFDRPAENSLDAVADRDFAIEFTAAAALVMMHLSRMSEELIIWSSAQFSFVELSDSFCTGSSIMPQKKNPDVPELVRGKSGRIFGHLMALLTLMKGQPLAYNKDNQEDKEPLFDTVDNLKGCLKVFTDMLPAISCRRDNMRKAATRGFATATDLADYLVRKGMPFRDAHEVVGRAVALCVRSECDLSGLTLAQLRDFSTSIEQDAFEILSLEGSVAARNHIGGTAPEQVRVPLRGRATDWQRKAGGNPMPEDSLAMLNRRLRDFAKERNWEQYHSPKNLSMAMIAECAELVEHFQWLTQEQSLQLSDLKKQEVGLEMADILIYLIRLAERTNIDLIDVTNKKILINEERYPASRVFGDARRADEYEEGC